MSISHRLGSKSRRGGPSGPTSWSSSSTWQVWTLLTEGLPFISPVDECVGFVGPRALFEWRLTLVYAWLTMVPLVTIFFNGLTLVLMKKSEAKVRLSSTKKKPTYTIPIRATLLSAIIFTLIVFALLCLGYFEISKRGSNAITTVIGATINAICCPLLVALTFSAKVRADLQDREKRQERVRKWAQEEREKRRVALVSS